MLTNTNENVKDFAYVIFENPTEGERQDYLRCKLFKTLDGLGFYLKGDGFAGRCVCSIDKIPMTGNVPAAYLEGVSASDVDDDA